MVVVGNYPPNFMVKLKKSICEAPILLLHKINKVGVNFISFFDVELLQLGVFGRVFFKLS
jgi:hypothetical protein